MKEKQIDEQAVEEMALTLSEGGCGKECDCIQGDKFNCHLLYSASVLYNAGYRKQSEETEEYRERIYNQREELSRLNKRINDLIQSREAWKKKAERVGKQLHEVLNKQSEGEWIMKVYPIRSCSVCGILRSVEHQQGWNYCPNCGAKMKGGAEG